MRIKWESLQFEPVKMFYQATRTGGHTVHYLLYIHIYIYIERERERVPALDITRVIIQRWEVRDFGCNLPATGNKQSPKPWPYHQLLQLLYCQLWCKLFPEQNKSHNKFFMYDIHGEKLNKRSYKNLRTKTLKGN